MKEGVFISICIPTYNQTEFLKKTFASIAEQTNKNFEVIVADDSTTSDVKLLTQTFETQFKVVYHKNATSLGSPDNWNKAMDLASGDLIKFMHHDDWFTDADALQKFVTAFEKNPNTQFVFCASKIIDLENNTVSYNQPNANFYSEVLQNPKILFNRNLIGAPSATAFRKTALRFDSKIKYVVDLDFYIRYLQEYGGLHYIEEALITNTSRHAGQVTAQSMTTATQIGEHAYLYEKLFGAKIPDLGVSKFFFFLFRQYPIKNLQEITSFGRPMPRPNWYFSTLLRLAKISLLFKRVAGK